MASLTFSSALVLAVAVGLPTIAVSVPHDGTPQAKGRYKQQGNICEWNATDDGPNQCEPIVKGRFKKGANDACTWDSSEVGADQCRPAKGRWKKDPKSCAWDGNDSGPDQCNPRHVK